MKQFIIEHLMKTQDARKIDIVFNKQKYVFGFGANNLTTEELAHKYNVTPTTIHVIMRKEKNRIARQIDTLLKQSKKPAIIKEVCKDDIDRSVPSSDLSIEILEPLTARTRNCLIQEGITTINQLLELSEGEMLKMPNLGRKSLNELKYKLKDMGLKFKGWQL